MSKVKSVEAHEIKDSRGNPTIEIELETDKGIFKASCPSGASTGKNEALELRDKDGRGVSKAIENVNKIIAKKLIGKDPTSQKGLDSLMIEMDGTENKSKLGANSILPVSMAICRAGAAAGKLSLYKYIEKLADINHGTNFTPFPTPMFNFIEGGRHTKGRNSLEVQEFMVVTQKKTFQEDLILANKVFSNLSEIIKKSYGEVSMGDEGGFAPPISKTEQAILMLKNAIGKRKDVSIAIDAAATQFYKNGKYVLEEKELSREQLLEFYIDLVKRFRSADGPSLIDSIEDPFAEEDWEGFKMMYAKYPFGGHDGIVGDDLTTTNRKRIKKAINSNCITAVIIKPNQIGTVSETLDAVKIAFDNAIGVIVSHRSGETMDTFIADLAVGVKASGFKAGSPSQPERMVKYNRILEIEGELKN
ncbi:MAG: enolase [Patescibacteria group bacterium]